MDDFEVIIRNGYLEVLPRAKIIDLNSLRDKVTSLFTQLGKLYLEKKVATINLIDSGKLVEDSVSAFYRLTKNDSRIVQVTGTVGGCVLEMTTVTGKLMDYHAFCQVQNSGFSAGLENIPVVQEFKTMNGQMIPYDHLALHKLLAREVPLLRF